MNKGIMVMGILVLGSLFYIQPAFAEQISSESSWLEEIIYEVYIKKYDTNTVVIAYKTNNDKETYIALNDFLGVAGFPIEVVNIHAKGTFFNNNSLDINLNTNTILVNNKEINYDNNKIKIENNQMYFASSLLEEIFSIEISINASNLTLNIWGKEDFPIEVEFNKSYNRKNNLFSYLENKEESIKYKMDNKFFSYPTVDFIASNRNVFNQGGRYQDNAYSFSLGAVILDVDANIYNNITYSNNPYSYGKNSTTVINFSRYLPYNEKNGSLKYFEFGDIYSNSSVFSNSGSSGRGILISSLVNHNINQDKTINIKDVLLPGWEVELYYNDSLIGYRTQADSSGYYNFNNIPVYSGLNVFKLVFYGPFGEKRTEEKKILMDASPVVAGEFAYTMSFFQDGHKLIENNLEKEYSNNHKTKNISSTINLYYGISNNLSVNLGYAKLDNNNNSDSNHDAENFYNAGLIYSINSFAIENVVSGRENYNKLAYKTSVSGSLDSFGYIYASYDYFNGIKSPASYMSDMLIDDYIQLRYNNYISMGQFHIPITIGYKRYKYDSDQSSYNIGKELYEHISYIRTSYNIYSNLDATLEYSLDKYHINRSVIKGIINSNLGNLLFRGYYERDITPKPQNSSFGVSLNYNLSTYASGYIQVDKYINNKTNNEGKSEDIYYQAGISSILPIGKISISYLVNKKKDQEINISYGISFGYDENNKSIYYNAKTPLNENGNIVAKVFVDKNRNGLYDKSIDVPIKNAQMIINDSETGERSDKNGNIYLTSLAAYNSMSVKINEESLEDIMLVPKVKQYNLILRPSTLQTLSFPFVQSGYIEGAVNTNDPLCKISVISVVEANNKQKVIEKTTSDKEGLFLIEALPYGNYDIQMECDKKIYQKNIKIDNYINYIQIDVEQDKK